MPETKVPLISSKWQHLIANRIYISGVRVQIGPYIDRVRWTKSHHSHVNLPKCNIGWLDLRQSAAGVLLEFQLKFVATIPNYIRIRIEMRLYGSRLHRYWCCFDSGYIWCVLGTQTTHDVLTVSYTSRERERADELMTCKERTYILFRSLSRWAKLNRWIERVST